MFSLNEIDPDKPVLIAGPTASGKSALAIEIAALQGGVIVNADALQVWDCWRSLSARPAPEEEARAPHRLYGHLPRGAPYSVGHWLREVAPILSGPARPIIVGGTGLYLSALTEGLAEIPPVPPEVRAEADRFLAGGGFEAMLAALDPETAARIDRRNPARVQRAWEVARATGRGLAAWQDETGPPLLPLEHTVPIVLDADRDWLADRIDRRFEAMVAEGALDEVRSVLADWDPAALWARAIGAPELVAHLRGETDLDTAIGLAQAASRQYAKRQRSWFRGRMKAWRWLARP
ncbi:tRNA (adenosine(37)-N6)-dimethylallyltransferase MiaA [Defluviimonas sp. D31]|uniref:tRNA (adenosine(37)-N6)-dimethylallyltransferase MiaA n=1 Tax=Defluviimonas sp. D31 TaxID=3083253 RepID=UPI00296F5FBE|nr:tRNA (adenosine(37)-N6)-dimethylallyltransferase MiaA [Defluviimonas sp. D31]MDW4548752.1 tRNA (adenosine(37)-N6)-dimethylallyltransferase MiaA [Defluviimonas sp. D31]